MSAIRQSKPAAPMISQGSPGEEGPGVWGEGRGADLSDPAGFTLIELLVIVATLAVLAAVFLPAQARSRVSTKAMQCLNNHRQLCTAWRMYSDDNRDLIIHSGDDSSSSYAWTWSHMDYNPSNRGNWDTNWDITQRPLWPYTARNAAIYKCPSDPSYVLDSAGIRRPRVRTLSMNIYLGGFVQTDGSSTWADPYRVYTRTSQFSGYSGPPNKIFVFLDERFDVVIWSDFMVVMSGYDPVNPAVWQFDQDMPGMHHDRACGFSFVDGHCEMKRWTDPRTTVAYWTTIPSPYQTPVNPDVYWLQDHSTRRK
jgi:type II secretory pathway pseudopilin PulG